MTVLTEGKHTGEFIISEANGTLSRETVVIAAAAGAIVAGTVLGKITASGKYVAYDEAGTDDGRRVAAAIAYDNIPDLAADQDAVAIVRYAEVTEASLTGLDANGKADLLALGIACR